MRYDFKSSVTSTLNFHRHLNVKCDGTIGFPIHEFLLVFNSNIWPNSAPLQDIKLQNLCDLDFNLSRALKVKCNDAIGLHIYGFLFMFK